MASWHPALWLLIMGPCCLVVRTRCPELGWWFSAAANGKKRRIGNSGYSSWCLFFKISRCSDGNCRGLALKPCLSSSLCVPGHQVSADSGHLATLALFHLAYHLKSCCLATLRGTTRCHWSWVSWVLGGAVDSLQSWFPTFSLLCTHLFIYFLGWIPHERFCPASCIKNKYCCPLTFF